MHRIITIQIGTTTAAHAIQRRIYLGSARFGFGSSRRGLSGSGVAGDSLAIGVIGIVGAEPIGPPSGGGAGRGGGWVGEPGREVSGGGRVGAGARAATGIGPEGGIDGIGPEGPTDPGGSGAGGAKCGCVCWTGAATTCAGWPSKPERLADDVQRPALHLLEDPRDVLALDAVRDQRAGR